MKIEVGFLGSIFWLAGIVLTKSGWLTAAAIFLPPYAWYVVVRHVLVLMGWVAA